MSFNLEDFRSALLELYEKPSPPSEREFVLWTGEDGMRQINEAMKFQVRLDSAILGVEQLKEKEIVNNQEYFNLKEMINSKDRENLTVVESIIKHYN